MNAKQVLRTLKFEQIHTLIHLFYMYPHGASVDQDLLGFYSNIRSIIKILDRRGLIEVDYPIGEFRMPEADKKFVVSALGKRVITYHEQFQEKPLEKL